MHRTKVGLGALAVLSLAAFLLVSSIANAAAVKPGAANRQDPQTANIPYVAWDGEQIRLVKCLPAESVLAAGRFVIEQWSGDQLNKPQFENNGVNGTDGTAFAFRGAGTDPVHPNGACWAIDVVSSGPGLAVIKLVVDSTSNMASPVLKHQFLAIWMDIASQTATELALPGAGDLGPGGATATGVFNPPFGPGAIGVRLTGSFPLTGNAQLANAFPAATFPGGKAFLPVQWPQLAAALAVDESRDVPGTASDRWDIHDDQTTFEGHLGNVCTPGSLIQDAVDNCFAGASSQDGPFSTIWGGTDGAPARGPFDPIQPLGTLLNDGQLNAGDAPMPAARVNVTLTGTAGALAKVEKDAVYNRAPGNFLAAGSTAAHNLYAPFYSAYIPATSRPGISSGIDGPARGNDFPGFLTNGLYDFWALLNTTSEGGFNACNDVLGNPIPTPTGIRSVTVYTDEHGEAIVGYLPNVGFQLTVGSNNRCFDITRPASFTSNISVTSNYPYQPPFGAPRPAASTLTKTVNTLSAKTLSCVPKAQFEMFCVETIRGFDGLPIAGARVEFTREPQGVILPDATAFGGFDTTTQTYLAAQSDADHVRILTGVNGQAGVLVRQTAGAAGCVDVSAENLGTRFAGNPGIFVSVAVSPANGGACAGGGGTTTTTGGTTTGGTTTGGTTTGGTTTGGTTTAGTTTGGSGGTTTGATAGVAGTVVTGTQVSLGGKSTPAKVNVSTLQYVKVVSKAHVGRYLVIRVNSKAKTARVHITLRAANGHVLAKAVRYVATNKAVKVPNLRLSPKVARADVTAS